MKIIIFFIFITLNLINAKEEAVKLTDLKNNEKIIIYFTSTGCFHNSKEKYIFTKKSVEIYNIPREWENNQNKYIEKTPELIGKFEVKEEQMKDLDKLLEYYNEEKGNGCTTIDYLILEKYKKDILIFTKNYKDASCDSMDRKDLITFYKFKNELLKNKK